MDFAVQVDHSKKKKKVKRYLDLAGELKHQWNIECDNDNYCGAGVLRMVPKGLKKLEIIGRIETIKITELLRLTKIPRRVMETWGNLLSLKFQWKTLSYNFCERHAKS